MAAVAPGQRRILLVEDNPGDAHLLSLALPDADIDHVSTGREALAYMRREAPYEHTSPPSLIVLDLNLPGLSGHEVMAELASDPALSRIPLIVLSSSNDPADVARSYDLHANTYIPKPQDFEGFTRLGKAIEDYWFGAALIP